MAMSTCHNDGSAIGENVDCANESSGAIITSVAERESSMGSYPEPDFEEMETEQEVGQSQNAGVEEKIHSELKDNTEYSSNHGESETNILRSKCEKYQQESRSLQGMLEELQYEFEASDEQKYSLAAEVIRLDSILKDVARGSKIVARELDTAAEDKAVNAREKQKTKHKIFKLENTIALLVEDYRKVTERLVDMEDALLRAARYGNDELVQQHDISQLEEKKEALEKEIQKMHTENASVEDFVNFETQQHKKDIEELNKVLQDSRCRVEMLTKSNAAMSEEKSNATSALADLTARHEKISRDLEFSLATNVALGVLNSESKQSTQKLESELEALRKEKEGSALAITDLTAHCDKLAQDLECSTSKIAELKSAKVALEESAQEIAKSSDKLGSEKATLEERVSELSAENKKLVQQQVEAKATIHDLSDEVLFAHEEISRLSVEKDAIIEESEEVLQKATDRMDELEEENRKKRGQYQELWSKFNASLLEKESAMASVEQLKQERGASADVEELRAVADALQIENEQHKQAQALLQEMNRLLESEKEVAVNFVRKDLELQNEELRQELNVLHKSCNAEKEHAHREHENVRNEMHMLKKAHNAEKGSVQRENERLRRELDALKHSFASKKEQMKSEEEDLKWKIDALQQNMNLRLNEKDSTISQLLNETAILRNQIQRKDGEIKSVESMTNTLPNLEAMIEEQQIELEQKDVLISQSRMDETKYKDDILRMQLKVERMEQWLHDSLSFSSPPQSPRKRISNPQSPSVPRSPVKGYSNPQTPTKKSFKK